VDAAHSSRSPYSVILKKIHYPFPCTESNNTVLVYWLQLCSLAVCKNRGGRPGPFYHMSDVSVYLGRQRWGGFLDQTMHFAHAFFILNQEQCVFHLANV